MGTLWALIANSSFAQIFEIKGHGKHIRMLRHIENPQGRLKSGEILADRPGRAFDRFGEGRHAMETDVKLHEMAVFARNLSDILKKGLEEKAYDSLVLIAPPQFLGELNLAIEDQVKKVVTKQFDKNLPPDSLSEQEVIDHLDKYLDLWNRD